LGEFCSDLPGRRAGVAQVVFDDIDAAVAEIERAHSMGLFGGIQLPAMTLTSGPGFHDPSYDPIWAVCEELGMPVNIHTGGQVAADAGIYGVSESGLVLQTYESFYNARRPLWFIIAGGVFDRFPGLKLVVTENMADWVAPLVHELDSMASVYFSRNYRRSAKLKPSEYWETNCYVGASFMSRYEAERHGELGSARMMWGQDYPHLEGTHPYTRQAIQHTFGGLPEDDVRNMLGKTCLSVYSFDHAAVEGAAERIGPRVGDLRDQTPCAGLPPHSTAFLRT
jgi:predicted TIM-barrel fold metal-dependent hydrolase